LNNGNILYSRRALLATGALVGCRRGGARVIGMVAQGKTHMFWQTIHAGAVAAAREAGVEIEWNAPSTEIDTNGQLQILDAMINKRLDAIGFAPCDQRALVSIVERAAREKIPVIVFDTGVETNAYTAWVATDNYGAGAMGARRVAALLGGKGKTGMIAVQPGSASAIARERGFEETIHRDFPLIDIVDKRFGMADFAKSLAVTENMLTAYPEVQVLFALNESSTVGAVRALKARSSPVKLVGFDWSPDLIEDLKAGVIDSLVVQDPFKIGYESVKSAVDALDGKPVTKVNKLPAQLLKASDLETPEMKKLLNPDLKKYLG